MKKEIHKGVGLLLTNPTQTLFFVQIKDNQYPFPEWRGACAYWGGAIETSDSSELEAVERELEEELPAAKLLLSEISKNKIDKYWVPSTTHESFWVTIFEAIVPTELLTKIAKTEVLEGYGALISLEELKKRKWIWEMDFVFEEYLKMKNKI